MIDRYWFHTVWTAKKLRRGDLWTAKACSDDYMKLRLLHMMELEAQVSHDWQADTWYARRFLERWANPRAVAGLRSAFSSYDRQELWKGRFATMGLQGN